MRPGYAQTLPGTCGVGLFHAFQDGYGSYTAKDAVNNAGIGYAIAGFRNTRICELVYKEIAENYQIVFQSPVKVNQNSYNLFFFIVYTKKGK